MNLPYRVTERTVENLVFRFLKDQNQNLDEYEGRCSTLCDEVLCSMHFLEQQRSRTMYIEHPEECGHLWHRSWRIWSYHQVIELDGLVHDGWCSEVLKVGEYLFRSFTNSRLMVTFFNDAGEQGPAVWRRDSSRGRFRKVR